MRIRISTIGIAIWGFGLNIALTKGYLDWVPGPAIVLMLAVPICIWAFVGLTDHRIREYLNRTTRIMGIIVFIAIGSILGGAVGGVVYTLSQRSSKPVAPPPAFSVKVTWGNGSPDDNKPQDWFLQGNTITPIYRYDLVNLTNLQDRPVMIDSYVIEQKMQDDSWAVANPEFGTDSGKFFHGGNLRTVEEIRYTTLDAAIANKNIAPHETVRGWIFMSKPVVGIQRIKIFDTTGESYTEPITGKESGGWLTQPIMIERTHTITNLNRIAGIKCDFKATITEPKYDQLTQQFSAQVLYTNDGDSERIVVGGTFIFREIGATNMGASYLNPGADTILGDISRLTIPPKKKLFEPYTQKAHRPFLVWENKDAQGNKRQAAEVGLQISYMSDAGEIKQKEAFFMQVHAENDNELITDLSTLSYVIPLDSM